MHFSCKITNSFIAYFESKGEDLSSVLETVPLSLELMRDSSYWMRAPDMEAFLEAVVSLPLKSPEPQLIQKVGHMVPQLRSWGVLDSVLRMMPQPQEVFHQPERFLSYFISPEPPVESVVRTETNLSFALPLPAQQYPLTSLFLKSAFEALPLYTGQQLAVCDWRDIFITIQWPQPQASIFDREAGNQISPALLNTVIEDLQKNQRELEARNRELQNRNEELLQAHRELQAHIQKNPIQASRNIDVEIRQAMGGGSDEPLPKVMHNLSRLHDYMVRAHQLVTMLSGHGKQSAGTKEALRRVDWDFVKTQYPKIILDSIETIRMVKNSSTVPVLPLKALGELIGESRAENEKENIHV